MLDHVNLYTWCRTLASLVTIAYVRIRFTPYFYFYFFQLNSWEILPSMTFWTSRGHRCLPSPPPVRFFIFIAHRVQDSKFSFFFVFLGLSSNHAYRVTIFGHVNPILIPGIERSPLWSLLHTYEYAMRCAFHFPTQLVYLPAQCGNRQCHRPADLQLIGVRIL